MQMRLVWPWSPSGRSDIGQLRSLSFGSRKRFFAAEKKGPLNREREEMVIVRSKRTSDFVRKSIVPVDNRFLIVDCRSIVSQGSTSFLARVEPAAGESARLHRSIGNFQLSLLSSSSTSSVVWDVVVVGFGDLQVPNAMLVSRMAGLGSLGVEPNAASRLRYRPLRVALLSGCWCL
jgi:hypothetical protein